MKRLAYRSSLVLFFLLAARSLADAPYVQPSAVDFKQILTTAPTADSEQTKQELAIVLYLQGTRTAPEIERAKSEVTLTAFAFSDVLGTWFNADELPVTAKLMKQVEVDVKPISDDAKNYFGRKRPFVLDDRVKPCVTLELTASFPSGHSTRATVWGTILSEMFPEQKDALMARSRQIGDDRVLAGMHFPSDVEAGRKLGAAIARQILANPDFKGQLEKAKAECMADAHRK